MKVFECFRDFKGRTKKELNFAFSSRPSQIALDERVKTIKWTLTFSPHFTYYQENNPRHSIPVSDIVFLKAVSCNPKRP